MYLEYLYNNDTQDFCRRVCELASSNESALRAQSKEVSRQTDTSSLAAKEDCIAKVNAANAVFAQLMTVLKNLSQSLSGGDVFGTQNKKADFASVCRAVTHIEEERLQLLSCIAELTQMRREVASRVADTNRSLHFLKTAEGAVPDGVRYHYADASAVTEAAYARLVGADVAVREVQSFYMTFIERHLPAFMERLRTAADFNHTGEALDRNAIRILCTEAFLLQNRVPNVFF